MYKKRITIGTRGSQLALYQAYKVKEALENAFPDLLFETEIITTKGDKILDVALSKIGDKGLFTEEIENALLNRTLDLAVHSLKDLPTALPENLCLGGVLKRGESRDALVSRDGKKLCELTGHDIIATSSLRRKSQLLKYNPEFQIVDIRGNVNTRMQKMQDGYCDAMVMAAAGLQRMDLDDKISEILDPDVMVPAVSQGAIGIEIRDHDPFIAGLTDQITHQDTKTAVMAERVFLGKLEGGCQIPVGCFSEVNNRQFSITGFVSNLDGSKVIRDTLTGNLEQAGKIAADLAESFLEKGAAEIVESCRRHNES